VRAQRLLGRNMSPSVTAQPAQGAISSHTRNHKAGLQVLPGASRAKLCCLVAALNSEQPDVAQGPRARVLRHARKEHGSSSQMYVSRRNCGAAYRIGFLDPL
jgi:hypothetical protein